MSNLIPFNWPHMRFFNHTDVRVLNKETFVKCRFKKLTFLYLLTSLKYFHTHHNLQVVFMDNCNLFWWARKNLMKQFCKWMQINYLWKCMLLKWFYPDQEMYFFLKEWTKSDKKQNCDAFEEIYAIAKKCWQACLIYKVLGVSLLTQTENIPFPSFFPQSNSPYLSFEWSLYGIFAKQ